MLGVLASIAATCAPAAPQPAAIEPFFANHCYDCHDGDSEKGDLNLEELKFDLSKPSNFIAWAQVFDRVESGEMPPKKEERPPAKAQQAFLDALGPQLDVVARDSSAEMGRVNVRRLTRREYEYTVHDLLGIDIPLQELLPEDQATHGFETVASGQQFSHFNLAAYLEAADLALNEAFQRAIKGDAKFKKSLTPKQLATYRGNYRGPEVRGDVSISWPMRLQFYGRMQATRVPADGWYRITLKDVHAINPKNGVVWGTLRSGRGSSDSPMLYPIGTVEATEQRRDLTYEAWIRKDHLLELKPGDATLKIAPSGATGGKVSYRGRDLTKQGFQGVAHTGIEIERIYPNAARWELRSRLLGNLPKEDARQLLQPLAKPEPLLRKAITHFASRAFRRPVTWKQVDPYVQLALDETKGADALPSDGLRAAYRAILCSPRFLTFVEKPGKLDAHAVAARLSYMLWNSMPDAQLRKLADNGSLLDAKVRRAQVDRLLNSPRADRFIESFTDQWLDLKNIGFTSPDRRLYRTFDPVVQDSMLNETRSFVKALIRDDASVSNIISSDFAMLNERLQRFYGMNGLDVKPGDGLQRVSLKGTGAGNALRGGLITQGAILKVTADGTTTSPIVRGVYVGERIIGRHIPPPPENVPAVEPDIRGAVSIRDQLAKHSTSASCISCHQKIDPPGFALENFDPVGLWRTKYGTKKNAAKVDPSGLTPDGKKFGGIWQWKQIHTNRPAALSENFAKHLLTYATGAEPRFSDRHAIQKIVNQAKAKNHGLRHILHAVTASEPFLSK